MTTALTNHVLVWVKLTPILTGPTWHHYDGLMTLRRTNNLGAGAPNPKVSYFHRIGLLGRFGLVVAMSIYIYKSQRFQVLVSSLILEKTITKPLINSTFVLGLPEGPRYPVLTVIKELLRQFESWRVFFKTV